jgi:hypothetical protein
MSENSDDHQDAARQRTPADDITEDLGQTSLHQQPSGARSSAGPRTTIHLPEKQQTRRRRIASRVSDPVVFARAGRHRQVSWMAAAAAALLAACISAGITLALSRPPDRPVPPRTSTSPKPCPAMGGPHHEAEHKRRRPRTAEPTAVLVRVSSHASTPALAPPASATTASTTSTPAPAPAQHAESEEQAGGGPFSP